MVLWSLVSVYSRSVNRNAFLSNGRLLQGKDKAVPGRSGTGSSQPQVKHLIQAPVRRAVIVFYCVKLIFGTVKLRSESLPFAADPV